MTKSRKHKKSNKSKLKTYFFTEKIILSSHGIVARSEEEAIEQYYNEFARYVKIDDSRFEVDATGFDVREVVDETKSK